MSYHWPGNIRELENLVERSLILEQGEHLFFKEIGGIGESLSILESHDFKDNKGNKQKAKNDDNVGSDENQISSEKQLAPLDRAVSDHIKKALEICNGRIEGEKGAAKLLCIHPSTLRKRMRKLGIAFGKNVNV